MVKGLVIAGERSGVGKTTITLALIQALRARGMQVQCFKVGPDFIDPGFHAAISGRQSRNLDGWMMGHDTCVNTFYGNSRDADIAVIEGVMGMFDGYDGTSEDGSTAQIAKWLNLPVLLVVDGSSCARSAGALVLGFERFDPAINLAGVLFNRVAGENHFSYLRDGVLGKCRAAVLGYVPRNAAWSVPERHLGLVLAHEIEDLQQTVNALARALESTVHFDSIIELAHSVRSTPMDTVPSTTSESYNTVRIGVARDEAFCFYYQDNLDCLTTCGAELVSFSPIHDTHIPQGLSGLYLGGGYPELHARTLSANKTMREELLQFCQSGKPVYAECGGFLYLLQSLTDKDGSSYDMAGLFPAHARMRPQLQRLGYTEITTLKECPFLAAGHTVRGHEFHYSDISEMPRTIARCYRVTQRKTHRELFEGYTLYNVVASYIHLHFSSNPGFAKGFIALCRKYDEKTCSA